jgi:hypothetical protein
MHRHEGMKEIRAGAELLTIPIPIWKALSELGLCDNKLHNPMIALINRVSHSIYLGFNLVSYVLSARYNYASGLSNVPVYLIVHFVMKVTGPPAPLHYLCSYSWFGGYKQFK